MRKPKAQTQRLSLREDFTRSPSFELDEANGILKGCKMCGLQSSNGRTYSPDALREAVSLYEGKPCYLNHREKGRQRGAEDDIGIWTNCRFVEGQGLFGDLKYELHAPYTPRLIDRAKRLKENVGFSHDADGDLRIIEGTPTVTKIFEVISVDLVADPATANGLNESRTMTTTVRKLLESVKTTKARQAWCKRLLEDDGMAAAVDVPAEAPADPKDAMAEAFRTGLHASVDAYVDGKLDLAAFLNQIKDFAKTHDKMTAEPEPAAPVAAAEQDDEKAGEGEGDKKMEQRIRDLEEANKRLTLEADIRNLCEAKGFTPSKDQLAKLVRCTDKDIRADLIESYAGEPAPASNRNGPRSRGTRPLRESRDIPAGDAKAWESVCVN